MVKRVNNSNLTTHEMFLQLKPGKQHIVSTFYKKSESMTSGNNIIAFPLLLVSTRAARVQRQWNLTVNKKERKFGHNALIIYE
jgi:hypothetical protein